MTKKYLTDIEIASEANMEPIKYISEFIGINEKYLELYGNYKAKVSLDIFDEVGMQSIQRKARNLTGYLEYLLFEIKICSSVLFFGKLLMSRSP